MTELWVNLLADEVVMNLVLAGAYLMVGVIVVSFLVKLARSFLNDKEIKRMLQRLGVGEHVVDILLSGIRLYLYFILLLIVLSRLGVSSVLTDMLIILLVIGIIAVLLFGIKNFVPNAAAGIYLSSTRMISKGDKIVVDKYEGKVEEINLLNTVLKRKEEKIIMPNALLIKQRVIKK